MMMSSTFIIFQFSIVVLLMATLTSTTNIPQPTSMIAEMSQSYDDERNSAAVFPDHHNNLHSLSSSSNHIPLTDDDEDLSSEEYDNDYSQSDQLKSIWPQIMNKRYADKVIRGDSRLWAIPYRFGKRAAMPYRFGKRAGMHFRLGKKSASL